MLYREIIAVCSEIHTKHTHTVSGQNVGHVDVLTSGKLTTGLLRVNESQLLSTVTVGI